MKFLHISFWGTLLANLDPDRDSLSGYISTNPFESISSSDSNMKHWFQHTWEIFAKFRLSNCWNHTRIRSSVRHRICILPFVSKLLINVWRNDWVTVRYWVSPGFRSVLLNYQHRLFSQNLSCNFIVQCSHRYPSLKHMYRTFACLFRPFKE